MITYAVAFDKIIVFADSAMSGRAYQCPHCSETMFHVEKDGLHFFRLKPGGTHKYINCTTWETYNNVFLLKNFIPSKLITDLMQPEKTQKPDPDEDDGPDIGADGWEKQTPDSEEDGKMSPGLDGNGKTTLDSDGKEKTSYQTHKQINSLAQLSESGLDDLFSNDVMLNDYRLSNYISTFHSNQWNPAAFLALQEKTKFLHIFEAKIKSLNTAKKQIWLYSGYKTSGGSWDGYSLLLCFNDESVFNKVASDLFVRTEEAGKTVWKPKDKIFSVLVASKWVKKTIGEKGFICDINAKKQVLAKFKFNA